MTHLTGKELRERLDPLCDAFEAAWLRGERPSLSDLVQNEAPEIRTPLFTELLGIELEFRNRVGEIPGPEEYQSRYAAFNAEIQALFREQNTGMQETLPLPRPESDTDDFSRKTLDETVIVHDVGQSASENRIETPELIGRYKVLRMLGRGGMGEVLFAEDTVLHRPVAIKLPVFSELNREELVSRFYREARAMAKVRHPNLCQIYEIGEIKGRPFLAMAYVDGETLAEKIRSGTQMSADDAVSIVRTLAIAIEAAHEEGVIHRDLKPGNVMIDRKGVPFITDFGLARNEGPDDDGVSTTGTVIGTPAYMSPEQVAGEADAVGPATDVYAIGVILYELLTGRRPFQGKGLAALAQIVSGNPPPAPSTFATVDRTLESICQKAMAFNPAARYHSADELAQALATWQNSREASGIINRRSPFLQVAAAAILAVAISAGYLFINRKSNTESEKVLGGRPTVVSASVTSPDVSRSELAEITEAHRLNPLLSPEFTWGPIRHIEGEDLNTAADEDHACISADARTLIFVRRTPTEEGLWQASRSEGSETFGPAVPVAGLDAVWPRIARTPFLTRDGLTLWFHSFSKTDENGADLWFCQRAGIDEPFGEPVAAGPEINTNLNETSPFVTVDGRTLLFRRGDPRRIFQATRNSGDGLFQQAEELTSLGDHLWYEFPRVTNDGLAMVLVTSRESHHQQIGVASRRSVNEPFSRPVSIGSAPGAFSSSGLALSADDRTLYFASDRPGGRGGLDLWSMSRVPLSSPQRENAPNDESSADSPLMSLMFDGVDDYVDLPTLRYDGRHPLTIESYVWIDTDCAEGTVTALNGLGLGKLLWWGGWQAAMGNERHGTAPSFPGENAQGRWCHVAAVFEPARHNVFVDGKRLKAANEINYNVLDEKQSLIGAHWDRGEPRTFLKGRLRELRISGVVRYSNDFTPPVLSARFHPDSETLALYHFDEGEGTTLHDSSWNSNHGIIHGAVWAEAE